ncbi:hypothetical protein GQ600_4105 [Phytophthora cactorum]|nr:hypothetical protein GQ600_4105 [Phytophthora cactorum]
MDPVCAQNGPLNELQSLASASTSAVLGVGCCNSAGDFAATMPPLWATMPDPQSRIESAVSTTRRGLLM